MSRLLQQRSRSTADPPALPPDPAKATGQEFQTEVEFPPQPSPDANAHPLLEAPRGRRIFWPAAIGVLLAAAILLAVISFFPEVAVVLAIVAALACGAAVFLAARHFMRPPAGPIA